MRLRRRRQLELHAAWLRGPYWEQGQIPDFEKLIPKARYEAVMALRLRHKL